MAAYIDTVVVACAAATLCIFGARRILLVGASLLPHRPSPPPGELPTVALVVAARNESIVLPRLLAAVDALDYPAELLRTVIVDDGSTDSTRADLERFGQGRPQTTVLPLPRRVGKAAALNAGIAAAGHCDVIVICDADLQPRPDCLRHLVAPFADPRVGAVSGYMHPANALASPVARYAAVETWMTQLVTSAGKDRLNLNPPTLGFCAYRRTAFDQIGGFPPNATGEDLIATVSLVRLGWRLRFDPKALADNHVVDRLRDYWRQHARWAGNTFDAGRAAGHGKVSPVQRIETWLMAAGYADRLSLLATAGLAAAGWLPFWLPVGYLALRGIEVTVALLKGGVRSQLPVFQLCTVAFFAIDIVASVAATAQYLGRRRGAWTTPRRKLELPLQGARSAGRER